MAAPFPFLILRMGIRIRSSEVHTPVQATISVPSLEAALQLKETFRAMATIEIPRTETHGAIQVIVTTGDESLLDSVRKKAEGKPLVDVCEPTIID